MSADGNPRIVIFGFISNDTERSMLVYPFISFPEWNMPFAKSRFIVRDGELTNINAPARAPEAIFSRASIFELPLLEYHRGYMQSDWERRFYHRSYLARLFVSWVPRWSIEKAECTDKALVAVNASILETFVRSATEAGVIPLVIYLPQQGGTREVNLRLSKRVLQRRALPTLTLARACCS